MKDYYPEGLLLNLPENKRHLQSAATLSLAQASETILEAVAVMCDNEHNLIVELGCMKGVIKRNEGAIGIADGSTRDIALISRVGRPVCFVVTGFDTDEKGETYAVLSRRIAQEKCRNYILHNKTVGDIISAKITHLESFGAFCDIGCGNIALMPIDAISVSRITHPRDRFKVGDDIRAVIKSIDENQKITLSHKELLGTWQQNADMFSVGQTVSGIVRSIEDYGIFVELTPNLAGLAEPKENVSIGQTAGVYIKSIIPEKMKIKLIVINNFDSDYEIANKYFYEGSHIDEFIYSPDNCTKQIKTYF